MIIKISNGLEFKLFNPGYTTYENEVFWKGINNSWEITSLTLWQKLSKKAKTAIDIGANTGIYSLVACAINKEIKVFAFEPVKRTTNILKTNLKLNCNFNIQLIEQAVSNENGKAIMYDFNSKSQYSASLNKNITDIHENRTEYDVETVKLDSLDFITSNKIDLLKIDIEMHEAEAIEGMIGIIERDRPSILIEILTDELANKIQSHLTPFNYLFFDISEGGKITCKVNLSKSSSYNFLICDTKTATYLNLI